MTAPELQIYLVGGAVRDALLGLEVKDRDWVVVGATPEQMEALGYRPVGKEFPVFIDPKSGEEYALARTERKTGRGYKGFTFHTDPSVTLEQDLVRRDLRINAIAQDSHGALIDPYDGRADLASRTLRHVSAAFAEDPLRVLRVARFAARFAPQGFQVAPETLALMRSISDSGELRTLTAERVWMELERALQTTTPDRFFRVLADAAALPELFPELNDVELSQLSALNDPQLSSAEQRFALFAQLISRGDEAVVVALCERLRIPNRYRDLALDLIRQGETLSRFGNACGEDQLRVISELKLQKSDARLQPLLAPIEIHYAPRQVDTEWINRAVTAVRQIQPRALLQQGFNGAELGAELTRRQLEALRLVSDQANSQTAPNNPV